MGEFAPHAVKIDARIARDAAALSHLLELAQVAGVTVVVNNVETPELLGCLQQICHATGADLHVQGSALDRPGPALHAHDSVTATALHA